MSKTSGCALGVTLGAALRAIIYLLNLIFKALGEIMGFLGLWIPFVYAIFGAILYLIFDFNPFSGDLDAILYLCGFGASCVCSLIISIRNIFVKPVKSLSMRFRRPENKEQTEEHSSRRKRPVKFKEEERLYSKETPEVAPVQAPATSAVEQPRIYYSAREKDTLIHEYGNRFEVYRVVDGRPILDKVEYKNVF